MPLGLQDSWMLRAWGRYHQERRGRRVLSFNKAVGLIWKKNTHDERFLTMDKSGPLDHAFPVNNMFMLLYHFSSQSDFLMEITDLRLNTEVMGKFQKPRTFQTAGIRLHALGSVMELTEFSTHSETCGINGWSKRIKYIEHHVSLSDCCHYQFPHLDKEEMGAQRGWVTCLRSHSFYALITKITNIC